MLPHHLSGQELTAAAVEEGRILNVLAAEQALEAERALCPPWSARIAARLFGGSLDRALSDGADPASSPRLAARAAMLTTPSTRAELADGLELILARAQSPPSRLRALPRHASVLANASLLRELVALLRGSTPLYASGVARVSRLLTDGTGPMYTSRDGTALERELRKARSAVASC
jgi:hypothetical protein